MNPDRGGESGPCSFFFFNNNKWSPFSTKRTIKKYSTLKSIYKSMHNDKFIDSIQYSSADISLVRYRAKCTSECRFC